MKTVLTTGGSRGIGKASAEIFKSNSYLVLTPKRDEIDLSSRESVRNFIDKNKNLKVDILINNAGIIYLIQHN